MEGVWGRVRWALTGIGPDETNNHQVNSILTQVLFDLGCGDGRVCIEAAKATGASAVGECDITTCG